MYFIQGVAGNTGQHGQIVTLLVVNKENKKDGEHVRNQMGNVTSEAVRAIKMTRDPAETQNHVTFVSMTECHVY